MHHVFNVGQLIDPARQANLSVALRLSYWAGLDYQPYEMPNATHLLAEQLAQFEMAFNKGENPPPYFAGIVSVPRPQGKRGLGFLVEDLSSNKKFRTFRLGNEYLGRLKDGQEEEFFVDPLLLTFKHKKTGMKYLSEEAMITIN